MCYPPCWCVYSVKVNLSNPSGVRMGANELPPSSFYDEILRYGQGRAIVYSFSPRVFAPVRSDYPDRCRRKATSVSVGSRTS